MAKALNDKLNGSRDVEGGISRITVGGYKSIRDRQSVEVRPLTILAGANGSGKSSLMQPLLLLKQTLEAGYDPGPLLLNGPHLQCTSADQLLWGAGTTGRAPGFDVGIGRDDGAMLTNYYSRQDTGGLAIKRMVLATPQQKYTLRPGMKPDEIQALVPAELKAVQQTLSEARGPDSRWQVVRHRGFLGLNLQSTNGPGDGLVSTQPGASYSAWAEQLLTQMIHLPGLRGNPARTHPLNPLGATFPGVFQHYVAGVIIQWQTEESAEQINRLNKNLRYLALTSRITARRINDVEAELHVGRLPQGGEEPDLVNLADAGLGVSQILPVLVALLVAQPGQLVYVEQPEVYLHPRAQWALAQILADAANRGVRVVAETHSALLLLGVQTLVAEGGLDPAQVKLHWFGRDAEGATTIASTDLDDAGTFGPWPSDFATVELAADSRFLDAAAARRFKS